MNKGSKGRGRLRWLSALVAGTTALCALAPIGAQASVAPSAMTPDASLFYDRVDNVFPDAASVERQLQFFQRNLVGNQQPDGRTDNFPQKVVVNTAAGSLTAGNIVANFGFEEGAGAIPDSWTATDGQGGVPEAGTVRWVNDANGAMEGLKLLRMEGVTSRSAAISQTIANPVDVLVDYATPVKAAVAPNSVMILSAFYKAEQVVPTEGGQGVYAKVTFLDEAGSPLAPPFTVTNAVYARGGWQELRGLVTAPGVQSASIRVEAGLDRAKGTVQWDGIRLMRVDTTTGSDGVVAAAKGTAAFPNGGFEAASPAWTLKPLGGAAVESWSGSAAGGYAGKGGMLTSKSADTAAALTMTAKASSNGTRQFGGDYRIAAVKYKTQPGFAAQDGRGVAMRLRFMDMKDREIGQQTFYGAPTNGQWSELGGVFDTPYPVHYIICELMIDRAVGTVQFDQMSYIGVDQQSSSTEAGFGSAGLLAYMWSITGKTDTVLAKRAKDALDFYLNRRVTTTDNPANASRLLDGKANSGEAYVPYSVSGSTTNADYPTTAFGLHNLAAALTYGQELFTETQLAQAKDKAYSMWRWLTRVTKFSTQSSMNQALVGLLGGVELAVAADDAALKREVADYYIRGLAGSNLPDKGMRVQARQLVDGRNIFYEVNGFDVSYAGVSLSDLADIIESIPDGDAPFGELKQVIRADGLEMADYFNARLAADGWIFAGSRHNEGGGSAFNMGNFSGLSYWGDALKADVGRFLIKSFGSTTPSYGDTANLGHIAVHGPVAMHRMLQKYPWNRSEQQKLEEYNLRKGQVSVYFKNDNKQPLNLSVSGTDFTEHLLDTGTADPDKPGFPKIDRFIGWYATDAEGRKQYDDVKRTTDNWSTPRYDIRKDTGSAGGPGGGANLTQQYYVTNGTSLYNVLAVRMGSTQSYTSLNQLIGLPYMSVPNRPYIPGALEPDRVRINGLYAVDGSPLLDLSADSGSAAAPAMVAGTARVSGWPLLKAENAPGGGAAKPTWLSKADLDKLSAGFVTANGKVMDDLYTKALWDPTNVRTSDNNGTIVQFANSDKLMVQLTDGAAAQYQAGDWVYFVSKIEPNASATGFRTRPIAKYAGRTDVLRALVVEDEGMLLLLAEGRALFVDKAGRKANIDGRPAGAAEAAAMQAAAGEASQPHE
ncbi:hypothetical protein [Paenibacillus elgii]|uniref:hypothetical protein n=1 Tax=Paenibacillus elgii TaxID=189691 RepID=UPI00203DA09F|nr:hypothetical protein [Paenibacillus elgii]MCM3267670.1 hypothetical protein [Paenibacillus elgii]